MLRENTDKSQLLSGSRECTAERSTSSLHQCSMEEGIWRIHNQRQARLDGQHDRRTVGAV